MKVSSFGREASIYGKSTVLFSLFALLSFGLFAQSEVSGVVLNDRDEPVYGAQIVHLPGGDHIHSGEDGRFSIAEISPSDTLVFYSLGYSVDTIIVSDMSRPLILQLSRKAISLNEVVIAPRIDALDAFVDLDVQKAPVTTAQDLLRYVPGLFIGQHAGGGKAEQIFLRGFDVDHGTDVSITVDGMPVNMVSHAHGQGYADLHFLIPELVEGIDFGKGAYDAAIGNFNTAGHVGFTTKESLEESVVKLEGGMFNTMSILGVFTLVDTEKSDVYVALDRSSTDGPFESPQNFSRINLFAKYTGRSTEAEKVSISISHFDSKWDASGQIPQRAVESGNITRFGAIDDTEGGTTGRTSVVLEHEKFIDEKSFVRTGAYWSNYDFELFSNFTFFLDDSINGDQIRQVEKRNLLGLNTSYHRAFSGSLKGKWQAGISLRSDQSLGNELAHTANRRETLIRYRSGDIFETNYSAFASATFRFGHWSINTGARMDAFDFQYVDALRPDYETEDETAAILSPKLNVLYDFSRRAQAYLKFGRGFHSNDTRVVVAQGAERTLPASSGADLGVIWKAGDRWLINTAAWYLHLEQEFVYVGDAGIVEPSGETERMGADLSLRYQPREWLFWNLDLTYTHARALGEEDGKDLIPLAPVLTIVSGIDVLHQSGLHGGLRARHLGDRPANEDDSITAFGYTVIDLSLGYNFKAMSVDLAVQNVLDTEWNETQFATESRLRDEPEPVEEIHFTPGTPLFVSGGIAFRF